MCVCYQVTTKEVELALAQSEKMLGETHFAAASLRELSWNLRELLEDFTARTREREKTLHEAADFFSAAEEVSLFALYIGFFQKCQHTCMYTPFGMPQYSVLCL